MVVMVFRFSVVLLMGSVDKHPNPANPEESCWGQRGRSKQQILHPTVGGLGTAGDQQKVYISAVCKPDNKPYHSAFLDSEGGG